MPSFCYASRCCLRSRVRVCAVDFVSRWRFRWTVSVWNWSFPESIHDFISVLSKHVQCVSIFVYCNCVIAPLKSRWIFPSKIPSSMMNDLCFYHFICGCSLQITIIMGFIVYRSGSEPVEGLRVEVVVLMLCWVWSYHQQQILSLGHPLTLPVQISDIVTISDSERVGKQAGELVSWISSSLVPTTSILA